MRWGRKRTTAGKILRKASGRLAKCSCCVNCNATQCPNSSPCALQSPSPYFAYITNASGSVTSVDPGGPGGFPAPCNNTWTVNTPTVSTINVGTGSNTCGAVTAKQYTGSPDLISGDGALIVGIGHHLADSLASEAPPGGTTWSAEQNAGNRVAVQTGAWWRFAVSSNNCGGSAPLSLFVWYNIASGDVYARAQAGGNNGTNILLGLTISASVTPIGYRGSCPNKYSIALSGEFSFNNTSWTRSLSIDFECDLELPLGCQPGGGMAPLMMGPGEVAAAAGSDTGIPPEMLQGANFGCKGCGG
jgi:hypothetical protein